MNATFEKHIRGTGIELLEAAGLQAITARKDDALSVRKQDTSGLERIDALHLLELFVEHEIAEVFFLIRANLEQNQVANDGIVNFGVVESLVFVVDGLAVNALAGFG